MTLRYQECAPCRRAGHYCPAAIMATRLEGEGDEPMCRECADGEPCTTARVNGRGRSESGVRVGVDSFGELVFASEPGSVHERTPEELGIPRVVIESCARQQTTEPPKEATMPKTTPEHIREAVIAAGGSASARELAERHGIGESTVNTIRAKAGIKIGSGNHPNRKPAAAASKRTTKPAAPKSAAIEPVTPLAALASACENAGAHVTLQLAFPIDQARAETIWKNFDLNEKAVAISAALAARLQAM